MHFTDIEEVYLFFVKILVECVSAIKITISRKQKRLRYSNVLEDT